MNKLDKQYTDLLQDILDNGIEKKDRTGTGTISVFGRQIRHKMSEGFPLITTKKMHWKSIVTELLWFLRGDTNIKFLLDYDCHIWDGDAYKRYYTEWSKSVPGDGTFNYNEYSSPSKYEACNFTKEEFIKQIKTDDEFAKKWGELGPIYGKQWRKWKFIDKFTNGEQIAYVNGKVDQIQNLINELKSNPDSRRLMVNAWNVGELDQMVLPPCHYGFQVYTRELSSQERKNIYDKSSWIKDVFPTDENGWNKLFNDYNIPTRAISLMWNQRSVDTFLGLPFNIASYGLLLEIIAKEVNMVPDELIGNLGDVHLYSNHIEQTKEQIGRNLTFAERYALYTGNDTTWEEGGENAYGWMSALDIMDDAGIPIRTREPYPLPIIEITERNWYQHELVKERLGEKTLDEKIKSYRPDCFELIGYESHPKIKAPLSN
jgi:thymidylate synthase